MEEKDIFHVLIVPLFALMFISANIAYAYSNIDVNISGNDEGSTSSVSVNSKQNSSVSNNRSSQDIRTDIRIETNGEVKTYSSDKPEDITIQSDDGNTRVQIKNELNNQTQSLSEKISATSESKIAEEKLKVEERKKETEQRSITAEKRKTEVINLIQNALELIRKFLGR